MGENKHIEELDTFTKKFVKEIKQEQPSVDFTASIMNVITKETKKSAFKVKALISKKGWVAISLFVAAAILIPFKQSEKSFISLPEIDFSFFDKFQISNIFESISISNTVLYAIFLFGLMIIAQVVFLKNYFNKRYH